MFFRKNTQWPSGLVIGCLTLWSNNILCLKSLLFNKINSTKRSYSYHKFLKQVSRLVVDGRMFTWISNHVWKGDHHADTCQCIVYFYILLFDLSWEGMATKKQGLKVNLLGDKQSSCEKYFEIVLRVMTGFGELIQFLAPFLFAVNQTGWGYAGLVLTFLGVLLFFISVKTMGINWRAGVNEQQRTELVTTGIYRFSRNPAFVAFDLLYLGFALIFRTSWWL